MNAGITWLLQKQKKSSVENTLGVVELKSMTYMAMYMEENKTHNSLQDILSFIGEWIDEGQEVTGVELHELYEWIEDVMVEHYEHL